MKRYLDGELAEVCEYQGSDGDSLPLWLHCLIIAALVIAAWAGLWISEVQP